MPEPNNINIGTPSSLTYFDGLSYTLKPTSTCKDKYKDALFQYESLTTDMSPRTGVAMAVVSNDKDGNGLVKFFPPVEGEYNVIIKITQLALLEFSQAETQVTINVKPRGPVEPTIIVDTPPRLLYEPELTYTIIPYSDNDANFTYSIVPPIQIVLPVNELPIANLSTDPSGNCNVLFNTSVREGITIRITQVYNSPLFVYKDVTIHVDPIQTNITIDKNISLTYSPGLTYTFRPVSNSPAPFGYTSETEQVASVDLKVNGRLIIDSAGKTKITIYQLPFNGFSGATVTVPVTIVPKKVDIITVKQLKLTYKENKTYQIITYSDAPMTLIYSSKNPKVATVNEIGLVTIQSPGKATITITQPTTNNYVQSSTTVDITVSKSLTENPIKYTERFVTLGKGLPVIYYNIKSQLSLDIGGNFKYAMHPTNPIASVSPKGIITISKAGVFTVAITQLGNKFYDNYTINVTFTITQQQIPPSITTREIMISDTDRTYPLDLEPFSTSTGGYRWTLDGELDDVTSNGIATIEYNRISFTSPNFGVANVHIKQTPDETHLGIYDFPIPLALQFKSNNTS